jgi:hypothetical protein
LRALRRAGNLPSVYRDECAAAQTGSVQDALLQEREQSLDQIVRSHCGGVLLLVIDLKNHYGAGKHSKGVIVFARTVGIRTELRGYCIEGKSKFCPQQVQFCTQLFLTGASQ